MSLVTLGSVEFQGFEVPGRIVFGGTQGLKVHKLIGGSRIVDVLGRDDSDLSWSGVLSGSGASDRARSLDAIRAAGSLQTLIWDAFCYAVVVSELELGFCNPWWIPYRIRCAVQADLSGVVVVPEAAAAVAVVADLASAGTFLDPESASALAAVSSQFVSNANNAQAATLSLTAVEQTVVSSIQNAGFDLGATDLGQVVSAAGSLATLCYAKGYLERSAINISEASF